MRFTLPLIIPLILGASLAAHSQNYNINNDTIRVSISSYAMLTFMGEIQDAQPLCSDYRLKTGTTTITIRPNTSKPVPLCRLNVLEGSKSSLRQHKFVIAYDKDVDPSEQEYDYSSKELILKRNELLAQKRKQAEAQRSGSATDDNPVGTGVVKYPKKPVKLKPVVVENDTKITPASITEEHEKTKSADKEAPDNIEPADAEGTSGKPEPAKTGITAEYLAIKGIPEEQLKKRIKLKVDLFYKTCSLLCAKTDVDATIKYGMKLFENDEEKIVAVTNSKTNTNSSKKIRQYFTHLSRLNYSSVVMTASDIKFISDIRLGPDGKYHASAVIIQDFKGYKDYDILAYSDRTTKAIDIIITTFKEMKDGEEVTKFDIFLGDISVTNTPK